MANKSCSFNMILFTGLPESEDFGILMQKEAGANEIVGNVFCF